MSKARQLADLLDSNGDVTTGALDNVPPSNDASALTTGTLDAARISDGSITDAKLASGAITSAALPTGSVLQAVHATKTTSFSVTATGVANWIDVTGLSVNITPISSSSTFLVTLHTRFSNTSNSDNSMRFNRNGVGLPICETVGGLGNIDYGINTNAPFMDTSFSYVDDPSTANTLTYKVQIAGSAGQFTIGTRQDGGNIRHSTISVMEIAG